MSARGQWLRFPHLLVKAFQPAVEMVRAIVLCQLVFLAVENELAVADAVGDATGDGASGNGRGRRSRAQRCRLFRFDLERATR